jgi:hypothetical protein
MCPDLSCHPGTFLQVSFPLSVASVLKNRISAFFYLDQNCTYLKKQARKITFLLANYYLSKKIPFNKYYNFKHRYYKIIILKIWL